MARIPKIVYGLVEGQPLDELADAIAEAEDDDEPGIATGNTRVRRLERTTVKVPFAVTDKPMPTLGSQ